jgi:hypothetical protein
MTTFPALVPSSRTLTPGEYPATAFSGYSGAQNRVRHSNVFLAAQLRLSFLGLTQAQMLDIWNHYNGRRGEFRSFPLPAEVVSYGSITDYVPGTYLWRYAGPGSVEDLPCGGHNVSLTLETVPPSAASVVGAQLFVSLRLSAGAADGGEYVVGISETVALSLSAGAALNAQNGLNQAIVLSLTAGEVIGDTTASGFTTGGIALSVFTGDALNLGAEGINETVALSLVAGAADGGVVEPSIGDAYGGGYFAGYISHTADGVATHRLIVAPRSDGATGTGYTISTNLRCKTAASSTTGTTSQFDGAANTAAMVTAGINSHPAAQFCTELTIGGFSDWYLPARYELDIAYENLKPTTASNSTSWGINDYSVPKRTANRTTSAPGQTAVTAFQSGQAQAFQATNHWSSTETGGANSWRQNFDSGLMSSTSKTTFLAVRAFRREAI